MNVQLRKKESYKIFDEIAGTYDFLNRILSCGVDIYWRKKLKSYLPVKTNMRLLDLATGTGDVPLTLAKHPGLAHIRGIDLSREMVARGVEKVAKAQQSGKIQLEIGDGVKIPFPDNSFDVITVCFGIRNFPQVQESLSNMHRVLKDGGRVLILEFSLPPSKLMREVYLFYFRKILPWIGNLLSHHPDAYSYLNKSVEHFPYGEAMAAQIRQAGFSEVHFIPMTFGIATLYVGDVCKRRPS